VTRMTVPAIKNLMKMIWKLIHLVLSMNKMTSVTFNNHSPNNKLFNHKLETQIQ